MATSDCTLSITAFHVSDLSEMEHHTIVKGAMDGLGSNQTKAILRVGKNVGLFTEILDAFDDQAGFNIG